MGARRRGPARAEPTDIVLVEPYQAGTSSAAVADALADRSHRLLARGVRYPELRRYGMGAEHRAAHGLDTQGIRVALAGWAQGTRSDVVVEVERDCRGPRCA